MSDAVAVELGQVWRKARDDGNWFDIRNLDKKVSQEDIEHKIRKINHFSDAYIYWPVGRTGVFHHQGWCRVCFRLRITRKAARDTLTKGVCITPKHMAEVSDADANITEYSRGSAPSVATNDDYARAVRDFKKRIDTKKNLGYSSVRVVAAIEPTTTSKGAPNDNVPPLSNGMPVLNNSPASGIGAASDGLPALNNGAVLNGAAPNNDAITESDAGTIRGVPARDNGVTVPENGVPARNDRMPTANDRMSPRLMHPVVLLDDSDEDSKGSIKESKKRVRGNKNIETPSSKKSKGLPDLYIEID
ncbi:hypothetical protein F5Y16DRAFT_185118 [Xylariaceae sp. FL0255]|nr:hypothetical protein F5Y16DRAFT_185118 [Xylariaceae sp. FL0255]